MLATTDHKFLAIIYTLQFQDLILPKRHYSLSSNFQILLRTISTVLRSFWCFRGPSRNSQCSKSSSKTKAQPYKNLVWEFYWKITNLKNCKAGSWVTSGTYRNLSLIKILFRFLFSLNFVPQPSRELQFYFFFQQEIMVLRSSHVKQDLIAIQVQVRLLTVVKFVYLCTRVLQFPNVTSSAF